MNRQVVVVKIIGRIEPSQGFSAHFLSAKAPDCTVHFGEKQKQRVILLQGPVGPFFKTLQHQLNEHGLDAWRICFNAGDCFFSSKSKRIIFYGKSMEWECWFADFIAAAEIDQIVLFGAERPIHRVARAVGEMAGIPVHTLEEGYVRPGFITAEEGGNNAGSPLMGKLPPSNFCEQEPQKGESYKAFLPMCLYGIAYYTVRFLFSSRAQRGLYHRHLAKLEVFLWIRNGWRWLKHRHHNFLIMKNLLRNLRGKFYLIPLQVDADSQMKDAALGWTQNNLVSSVMKSFAKHAPDRTHLVFKIHPLERGHTNLGRMITEVSEAYGIADRVSVIDSGPLASLTRRSAGMITINSTSGFSAIYHGIPLLVVGQTFYAHPELVTCGNGAPDFDRFWSRGHVAPLPLRRAFISWMYQEALIPGDFYAKRGIALGCSNFLPRLKIKPFEVQERAHQEQVAC